MTGAVRRWLRRVPAWVLPAFVAVAAVGAAVCWWDWLRCEQEPFESNGETLRNIALILVAIVGLPLALWRNLTAYKQAETAARGLRNERYQKGADMLGNATLATRLGGVYALEQLVREHPEEYHIQIVDLLCAFIRHPVEARRPEFVGADGGGPDGSAYEPDRRCAPDIEAAARAIGRRRVENDRRGFFLNLRGANLSGAILSDANLERADLEGANLSDAILPGAKLSGAILEGARMERADLLGANLGSADLEGADLLGAELEHADLEGATLRGAGMKGANLWSVNLSDAILSGADLSHVEGLKQSGLDAAIIWTGDDPPRLEGALDAETGQPLVWQGEERPPEDEAGD